MELLCYYVGYSGFSDPPHSQARDPTDVGSGPVAS